MRVARAMCTAGWPGKTCLSVCGTSLASLSPRDPCRCPEAGRLGGGTSLQGRPQAVCVHYSYGDGMRPAGGWTFTPYLLWSSALEFFACIDGWLLTLVEKTRKKVREKPWLQQGSAYFTCDLPICDRFTEAICTFKWLCLHIYTLTELLHLEEDEVVLQLFLDTAWETSPR